MWGQGWRATSPTRPVLTASATHPRRSPRTSPRPSDSARPTGRIRSSTAERYGSPSQPNGSPRRGTLVWCDAGVPRTDSISRHHEVREAVRTTVSVSTVPSRAKGNRSATRHKRISRDGCPGSQGRYVGRVLMRPRISQHLPGMVRRRPSALDGRARRRTRRTNGLPGPCPRHL